MSEAVTPDPVRRLILATLNENNDGMTSIGLASLLNKKRSVIVAELTKLSQDDEAIIDRHNSQHHAVWVLTPKGEKAVVDQRFAAKERKCMCCFRMFWSAHAGNRICPTCSDSENMEGLEDVAISPGGRMLPPVSKRRPVGYTGHE